MLKDFFNLDDAEKLKEFKSADDFVGHFQNSTSLQHATIEPGLHISEKGFKDKAFENVRLSKVVFERVTFTRCEFRDCLFVGSEFIDCEFHSCKFFDCNTHKLTLKNVYLDPRAFSLNPEYRKSASNIGVYLFQELFKNASEGHLSHFAPLQTLSDVAGEDISFGTRLVKATRSAFKLLVKLPPTLFLMCSQDMDMGHFASSC